MTADERKRGLRAAYDRKMKDAPIIAGSTWATGARLLWEIIDALIDECDARDSALATEVRYILKHYADVPQEALVHLQVALERLEQGDLHCHVCGKPKGQSPTRCPGHYERVRPAESGCALHRGAPLPTCNDCLQAAGEDA